MDEAQLGLVFAEMDLTADQLPWGSAFWADAQIAFRQIQKSYFPDLTKAEWLALFDRWRNRRETRRRAAVAEVRARTARLLAEKDALEARCKTLPADLERVNADRRLWAIANEIADLCAPRGRPRPTGAAWVPTTASWPGDDGEAEVVRRG